MARGNRMQGSERITNQVRETINLLMTCGLPRRAFSVRNKTHYFTRNGFQQWEYGDAQIFLKETQKVTECLSALIQHFDILAIKKGEIICFYCAFVPGREYLKEGGYITHVSGYREIDIDEEKDHETADRGNDEADGHHAFL